MRRITIGCTGAAVVSSFAMDNLSPPPGDPYRYPTELPPTLYCMNPGVNPYEPTNAPLSTVVPVTSKRGPSVRIGFAICTVLTLLYWFWESRAGGNIRVDLLMLYPLLFGLYLHALQRLGWISLLIALALMALNLCFFMISYSLFDKPIG